VSGEWMKLINKLNIKQILYLPVAN